MSAIITETFRRHMRDLLEQDMIDNPYYIGIGKSNQWEPNITGNIESSTIFSVPIPKGTPGDDLETKNNLTTLIKIQDENISAAIPKVIWKSGNKYKAYNPHDETCFYSDTDEEYPCYAINESTTPKRIYLCVKAGTVTTGGETSIGPSVNAPTGSTYGFEIENDGYVWVYIQDYINEDDTVNSSSFLQIHKQNLEERGEATEKKAACRDQGGKIYGFTVVNGGSGYDVENPPTLFINIRRRERSSGQDFPTISNVTFNSNFQLKPIITDVINNGGTTTTGVITGLTFGNGQTMDTLLNTETFNNQIISASIEIVNSESNSGSGALIVPHISPYDGFGYHPSKDFPGWYLGLYTKLEDNTSDSFFIPYRQISIIKAPTWNSELGSTAPDTLNALRYFVIDADENSLPADITGRAIRLVVNGYVTKPIIGYADFAYDDTTDSQEFRLYFHQAYSSGYGYIPPQGIILVDGSPVEIEYNSLGTPEYVQNSGEVIFVENRKPIVRTAQQAEELKIIIQL
jgi:hypothetical protein